MLSKENKNFACKLQSVVRILSDMVTLTEIGTLLLIGNAIWFIRSYRRNKCIARRRAQMRGSLDRYMDLEGGTE